MRYTDSNNNLLALVIAGVAITITTTVAIMTPLDAFAQSQGQSQESQGSDQSQSQESQGSDQSQRVGVHDNDDQTSGEGASQGGTVSDPTIPNGQVSANCFGKVIEHEAQEHKENPDEGTLGEHSSDPVPELEGNETPRQGIGNQDQGHPAAHGAFNSGFDEDDAENVEENC
jgi:hypothetical protein